MGEPDHEMNLFCCSRYGLADWVPSLYPGAAAEDAPESPQPTHHQQSVLGGRNLDFLSELSTMPGGTQSPAPSRIAQPATPKCASEHPLIAATIYAKDGDKAWVLSTVEDLSQFSWWSRSSAGEFLRFGSRQVAQSTQPGCGQSILPDDEHSALQFCCHGYCEGGNRLVATMVT